MNKNAIEITQEKLNDRILSTGTVHIFNNNEKLTKQTKLKCFSSLQHVDTSFQQT